MKRSIWIPFLALALVLLAGLIVSALEPMRIRAFALGSPPAAQVAVLDRGQQACEGPVRVQAALGGARFWGSGTPGSAWVKVTIRNAITDRALATGWTVATPLGGNYDATLEGSVPAGSIVRVCVTGEGPGHLSLAGSAPIYPQILMSFAGKPTPSEFSLVLFEYSRQSLLAALPTAFSRAALFRFSWFGPWAFWVLAVALLGTVVSCGWALVAATRADSLQATKPDETFASDAREAPVPLHLNE